MSYELETVAIVTLTVEVTLPDRWGSDCTIAQVYKQALDGVERQIKDGNYKIVGQARVRSVVSERVRA